MWTCFVLLYREPKRRDFKEFLRRDFLQKHHFEDWNIEDRHTHSTSAVFCCWFVQEQEPPLEVILSHYLQKWPSVGPVFYLCLVSCPLFEILPQNIWLFKSVRIGKWTHWVMGGLTGWRRALWKQMVSVAVITNHRQHHLGAEQLLETKGVFPARCLLDSLRKNGLV